MAVLHVAGAVSMVTASSSPRTLLPPSLPSLSKLIPLSLVELASFQMDYFLIMRRHLNRQRHCGRDNVFLLVRVGSSNYLVQDPPPPTTEKVTSLCSSYKSAVVV